jgi:hypothetical protein
VLQAGHLITEHYTSMNRQALILGYFLWIPIWWLYGFVSVVSAQTLHDPDLRVAELAGGLSQPTTMAFIAPGDILVLQKANGQVRRVINGMLQSGLVLDVAVAASSAQTCADRSQER